MIFKYSILAFFFTLSSCATVRVVKSKPGKGGELAVKAGLDGDGRDKANQMMASNCGPKYSIVEEGEAVVGSTTTTKGNENAETKNAVTSKETSATSETSDKTEWRIKYKCNNGKGKGKSKKSKK